MGFNGAFTRSSLAVVIFLFCFLIFMPIFEDGAKWNYVVPLAAIIGLFASPVFWDLSKWRNYSLKIFLVLVGWYAFLFLHARYFPPITEYAVNKLPYLIFVSTVCAFLIPAAVENTRAWTATAIALFAVGLAFTIISFFPTTESSNARYSAIGLSPTMLAKLTVIPIIATIAFKKVMPRYRVLLYLAAILAVAGCINTGSRTPLIAVCIAYLFYLLIRLRASEMVKSAGLYVVFGAIFLIYLGFANPEVVERFSFEALSVAEQSDEGDRIFLFLLAIDLIRENFFGIGLGNFSAVFWLDAPHNIYLEATAETGWFGLIPVLALTWIGLKASIQLARLEDGFAQFISIFFFYKLITGLVGNELTLPSLMFYLSLGLSAVYAHALKTGMQAPERPAARHEPVIGSAVRSR